MMSDDTTDYNLKAIRELLLEAFTAEDLRRFCLDDPRFRPICDRFGHGHGLDDMVDQVIDHCRTHSLWPEFLATVEQARPDTYARFADRLPTSASPSQAPPSPLIPSAPAAKGCLSGPVFWVVIAALILVVVCWLIFPKPSPPVVALKTTHNRYVRAMGIEDDWKLMAVSDVIGECERFTLLCQNDGTVVLQTCHKTEEGKHRYVTAMGGDYDWVLRAETGVILDWEKFTFVDVGARKPRWCSEVIQSLKDDREVTVAFQTWHTKEGKHRLVTAMDEPWHWVLRAETTELGASEEFTMILLPWAKPWGWPLP